MAFDKAALKANTPKAATEVVAVPGWGDTTVRGLTGEEFDRCDAAFGDGDGGWNIDRPLLVRLTVIDPATGAHVFDDSDLPFLRSVPITVLAPAVKAALRLTGLGGN